MLPRRPFGAISFGYAVENEFHPAATSEDLPRCFRYSSRHPHIDIEGAGIETPTRPPPPTGSSWMTETVAIFGAADRRQPPLGASGA